MRYRQFKESNKACYAFRKYHTPEKRRKCSSQPYEA